MLLTSFKAELFALLENQQQNAIADILIQIKRAPYHYDKVLFTSIQNKINPMGLSLMVHELVGSTKTLIDSLAEKSSDKRSEYDYILDKIETNRGIGTTNILLDKTVQDLDEVVLARIFQSERVARELNQMDINWKDKTIHERLVLLSLGQNGHLYKGSFLCLGKAHQISGVCVSATEVKFTHFKGITRQHILEMEDVKGGLILQYERIMQLLRIHIPLARNRTTDTDEYEIPMEALRELIVNAFVHRDYSAEVRTSIQIELYDDRLEIKSPGLLPEGVEYGKMEASILVNPIIMAVFHLFGFAEKRGTGIPTVLELLHQHNIEPPKVEEISTPKMLKITIFRKLAQQAPTFNIETQNKMAMLIQKKDLVGIFVTLDSVGLQDYVYQRLKEEFMFGKTILDASYFERLFVYVKTLFPNIEIIQDKPIASFDKVYYKDLIAKGKIEQAIKELLTYAQTQKDGNLENDIIMLSLRFNQLKENHIISRITQETYTVEQTRIATSLLYFLDATESN